MNSFQKIELYQNAWHGDNSFDLFFPKAWEIHIIGNQDLPALKDLEIQYKIQNPIQSLPIAKLAQGKSSVAILIDDLSRPTPTDQILPFVYKELQEGGIDPQNITIVVCGGTHKPINAEEMGRKLGNIPIESVKWVSHNCHANLIDLGFTSSGIPIKLNRLVAESDMKIGIGCIYPHPVAGFSGGPKILAPGAAGFETIRSLHYQTQSTYERGGTIGTEFRLQIQQIATKVGLDYVINASINQTRKVCGIYAGHAQHAFEKGVEDVSQRFKVVPIKSAQVIIADLYPFDSDLQVAFDRGLWPLDYSVKNTTKLVLASCPRSIGNHELSSITNTIATRLYKRIRNFRSSDLQNIATHLRTARKVLMRKNMQAYFISDTLKTEELQKVIRNANVINDWGIILENLCRKYDSEKPFVVAIYRCAPLMLPVNNNR